MKSLSTLRSRLLLSYLGLILIGFGGLTLFADYLMTDNAKTKFKADLQVQALSFAATLVEAIEHQDEGTLTEGSLQKSSASYLEDSAVFDILLIENVNIDLEGTAALDDLLREDNIWIRNAGLLPTEEVFAIIKANQNEETEPISIQCEVGRGVQRLHTATPIIYDESETLGLLQVGQPTSEVCSEIRANRLLLGGAFAAFSIVGIVICLGLIASLTRPLSNLRDTALEMADGDLSQRVANPKQDEIGEVGRAFNQMADQVEAMVAEQRAFASNASHELRTPLTTIRLRTEWLLSGMLDEATTQQYIHEIDQEANRMGGLVDDLILLSRLDAHRLELGQEQIDPVRLVQKIQRETAPLAEHKEITVTLDVQDKPLPPVQANMNHLHVVFRNLIENALKYTPQAGKVTVTLTSEQAFLQFQVTDNGRGIAPEDLPHLTQRFYRADKAHSRQIDGVGLGLALVQSTVELYQGRFEITSAGIDQGTTATVWWPFAQGMNREA